ncbi:MAG TPA: putative quinol monooxygenase [Rhodopila sp.]|jgi:autoinducer 2-degrading protein|nr:putative quinol monooxygenase [Rhodopila sp.]
MTHYDAVPEEIGCVADPAGPGPTTRRSVLNKALAVVVGLCLSGGLLPLTAMAAHKPNGGQAVVNVVTFQVPAAKMAEFLRISRENSQASLREERGCLGFEVLRPEGKPDTVMLIETYRNEAAYKAHRVTAHFLAFVKASREIGVKRSARVADRYYPN